MKSKKKVETFDEAAKCHVLSVHYDVINKVGSFVLAEGHCSDMNGAIRIFTRIDPDVQRIIDGNTEWRKVDGKWSSFRLPPNPNNEFCEWNAKDYFGQVWGSGANELQSKAEGEQIVRMPVFFRNRSTLEGGV